MHAKKAVQAGFLPSDIIMQTAAQGDPAAALQSIKECAQKGFISAIEIYGACAFANKTFLQEAIAGGLSLITANLQDENGLQICLKIK